MSQVGRELKVLDANGREIQIGSRVLLTRRGRETRQTVKRIHRPVENVLAVALHAAPPSWAEERNDGSFTCPDLVLQENNEKEAASDR